MSKLNRNLAIVWDETTFHPQDPYRVHTRRYIARPTNESPGWGVFDRRTQKFLSNSQIRKLGEAQVREAFAN
jgi:hypothetical protein